MVLVWNDAKSFRRHVEAMRTFRLSHCARPDGESLLRDMPAAFEVEIDHGERPIRCLTDAGGRPVFVPIWKIDVAPGARN